MPMSLKCMIGKWLHKNQISQEEYDAVMKKLEGHDKQIKADGAREFLAWYSGGETMPSFGRYAKCNIDDVIAEWQKGAEND